MAPLRLLATPARTCVVSTGMRDPRLELPIALVHVFHHDGCRAPGAQSVGQHAHRFIDVMEEVLETGAEVVETGITVGRLDETVLRAFSVTREAHIAVTAVLREQIALAIGITAFRLRVSAEDEAGDIDSSEEDAESAAREFAIEELSVVVAGPVGRFSVLRATAVVVGVVVGFWWFEAYPLWVAITVVVVVKPSPSQGFSVAVQRTLGTAIGVGVAVGVAQMLPRSDVAVAIAFLISGFLMVAFNNANYTMFATFLTAMLVFGQRLAHADAFEAGWERLLATAVGAGIALMVMIIAVRIGPNRRESNSAPSS